MDNAVCAHKSVNSRVIRPQPVNVGDDVAVKLLAFPAAAHKPRHQRANHINNSL